MKKMQFKVPSFVKSKPFSYFIIGLIVIGILIYLGYRAGKRKYASSSVNTPYPDGGATLPAGGQPILEDLVKQTYDVLDGFDFSQSKEFVFQRYAVLTNDQVTYVYKRWNDVYQAKEKMTLTQRIEDEAFLTTAMETTVAKLRSLNLF